AAGLVSGTKAQRASPNLSADYNKSLAEGYSDSAGMTTEFSQRLNNKIRELLQRMERNLKSADPRDSTVHTGWAGIADVFGDPTYLQMAHGYVKQSLNCLTKHSITFLCRDRGPLAVAAVKNSGVEKIPQSHIQQICETVLTSGEDLARKTPLVYEWHQEYHVGAAHGLAGIYYHLRQPSLQVSHGKLHSLVKPSGDYVCQLKFPSGNYPPRVDDTRDMLVHWCHGSPGVICMLIQAYKVFKEEQSLNAAHPCADDAKYLYRACKFAECRLGYGEHGCRTPDTPFSLSEGMAGTIHFLADLLAPTKARFPAFEL
ncbi:hypothetical protein E2I00_003679, partial [Balaenoptera physalus]